MKTFRSIAFVGLVLALSMVLQGCVDSVWGESEEDKKKALAEKGGDDEEDTAQCYGSGNFSCSGNWKSWCAEQERKCNGGGPSIQGGSGSCTPKCKWECGDAKCNQVCAPKCNQALCSTRCKGFNTQSCEMKCGQPNCKVVCPPSRCPGRDCPNHCKTECSEPVCQMQCKSNAADQPCKHVCAQPQCKWECKKPEVCPKPKCTMKCEKPVNCMDNTHVVQELPPMEPGETEVAAFATSKAPGAPAAAPPASPAAAMLQSIHGSSMRVEITTMGQDRSLQKSQAVLKLVAGDAVESAPTTWTKTIRKRKNKVTESEASCGAGGFRCNGDADWCAEQQKLTVCEDTQAEEAAAATESEEQAAQIALQPSESMDVMSSGAADAADAAANAEAEMAAEQALKDAAAKLDSAFLQQRLRKQSHLQA